MAGIWERIKGSGMDGEGGGRVNVSLLRTELTGVGLGIRTSAEARASIEAELNDTLSGDEVVDLNAMVAKFETGATQSRLVYSHKTEFALNAGELGLIDEATFRAAVEIP